MRKLLTILLSLLMLATVAHASEPANPADPEMVAELLPGYTFIKGIDDRPRPNNNDELRLLMRNPAGELVFIGGVLNADGTWALTESTPLPEGTILGVENFTHSLGIPSGTFVDCVSVKPYADGTWGINMIDPWKSNVGTFFLSKNVIDDDTSAVDGHFGDHPWSDITAIDWTALPASLEEAIAALDTSRWAVVSNPDPADRLHLRVSADRNSASLGKYYNRTPVLIRQYGREWCAVTVCGVDGWMMTEYLAFGADMDAVEYAGPGLDVIGEETPLCASANAASEFRPLRNQERFYVLGVVGDEWYHVWLPGTEEYGYVRQDALWPGNG